MSMSSTKWINTLPTLFSNNCQQIQVAYLPTAWTSSLLRENPTVGFSDQKKKKKSDEIC